MRSTAVCLCIAQRSLPVIYDARVAVASLVRARFQGLVGSILLPAKSNRRMRIEAAPYASPS